MTDLYDTHQEDR